MSSDLSTMSTATSVNVHGTSLPYTPYTAGRYFNTSGTTACTCHGTGGVCLNLADNTIGTCNSCGYYSGGGKSGWQCMGFAYMVYYKIWGNFPTKNTAKYSINTTALAREVFWNIPSGTYVRFLNKDRNLNTSTQGDHSIIVADVTSNGVLCYEANRLSGCKISYEMRTFAELSKDYSGVFFTYDDQHTFSSSYGFDSNVHWQKCSKANCNGKLNIEQHTFTTTGSVQKCTVCKYSPNNSTNSVGDETINE